MTTTAASALMGIANRFAAELENLSDQTKSKRVNVSAKILSDIAARLTKGSEVTGVTESRLVEECLKESLPGIIRRFVMEREAAIAEWGRENYGESTGSRRPTHERKEDHPKVRGTKVN